MDNPWVTAWENTDHLEREPSSSSTWSSDPEQDVDIGLPSWSTTSTSQWTATSLPAPTIWPALRGDANAWVPSPTDDYSPKHHEEASEQDITAHSEQDETLSKQLTPSSSAEQPTPPVSDHQLNNSSPPTHNPLLVAETFDGIHGSSESVSRVPEQENPDTWGNATILAPADNDWGVAWATTSSAEGNQQETQSPDEWETARQEKEKLNRAVPPQLLESMIRHCQQVSEEIWPPFGTPSGDNWRTGLDDLPDIASLLAQLLPDDTLPPPVQFSGTATAKAMNEALKLTRHMPLSARSPLSRLLASRGSLDWERSIKSKQDTIPDTAPVGWRVLEKEDRVSSTEDSKPKTAASGLLSFWNRSVSTAVNASTEMAKERSMSPTRSSLDTVKPDSPPDAPRAASPSQPPPFLAQASSSTAAKVAVSATTSTPSAVSRFFNRFSRPKSTQHSSLALSSNDFEFLSDIVPSASDPDDEHGDKNALEAFSSVAKSSPLPPKLPPPLPPPPKSSIPQSRPPSSVGLGISNGGNVPAPPLSPNSPSSFSRAQSPALLLKGMVPSPNIPTPATSSISPNLPPGLQPNSRPHSPFTLPPPPKVPTSLSIPPLLPPLPLSPPQTPRPSVVPMSSASTTWTTNAHAFYDSHDSDDEFSAFSSFSPAPFPSMGTYPQRSPSPPSPPPRRTYERRHHPSTSSASSAQSPSSQNSGDRLRSARSSISASLDGLDDFVSPPTARGGSRKRTPPPPPPIPAKPQAQALGQRQLLDRIDTFPSRIYHAHAPSHTFASPTVHTGLMSSAFSSTVSDVEHQRTQHLVDDAATHGGLLWPNSPEPPPHPRMRAIPPPPSSSYSMSPDPLTGEDSVDLLGDGDFFGSAAMPALPAPLVSGLGGSGIQAKSSVMSPVMNATRAPLGVGREVGVKNSLLSSSPLPPSSPPLFSFSSLGAQAAVPVARVGSSQAAKPAQPGGLSAQDLSFFEGL